MSFFQSTVTVCCLLALCATCYGAEKPHLKLYYQGVEANKAGRLDEALGYYDKALALKPDAAGIYYVRGRVYETKGELDRALRDFSKAVQLKPGYAEAYNHRGVAYVGKKLYPQALADFNKACQLGLQNGCANAQRLSAPAPQPGSGAAKSSWP